MKFLIHQYNYILKVVINQYPAQTAEYKLLTYNIIRHICVMDIQFIQPPFHFL